MFEWPIDAIAGAWNYLQTVGQDLINGLILWAATVRTEIASFNPTQRIVLWIQFGVGILTIIWIIFQFAWLRRLNEARLERHLEETITTERDDLADERTTVLDALDRVVRSRGLRRYLLLAWAHFRLTMSLITRLLSLGTTRGLADHNLLLMKVGAEQRARSIFAEVAREAIKKIKLYKDAIDNKTLEAQNALLFAGRVALVEGRTAAAVLLFRAARNLREDAEARLLIGKQMAGAGALDAAMLEFSAVLMAAEAKPSTKSETHRAISLVHLRRNNRGLARQSLGRAENIDYAQQDFAGLGRTQELIGDLYKPRTAVRRAALEAFNSSAENYERAQLPAKARAVRRKFTRLKNGIETDDGWWTLALERCARWLLRQVEKQRVQARTTAT